MEEQIVAWVVVALFTMFVLLPALGFFISDGHGTYKEVFLGMNLLLLICLFIAAAVGGFFWALEVIFSTAPLTPE